MAKIGPESSGCQMRFSVFIFFLWIWGWKEYIKDLRRTVQLVTVWNPFDNIYLEVSDSVNLMYNFFFWK